MKKILYGVSGIGNGHSNRQLSLITELSKDNLIYILCYDESLNTFKRHFSQNKNIKLIEIAVPFIVGVPDGLDFGASITHPFNQNIDFLTKELAALDIVNRELGFADLVVSDYEPLSAKYAYSHNIPLVTIDQQSKFLHSDLPKNLGGFTYEDEVQRLHMFFPKAAARISCSFFRTKKRIGGDDVLFFPPPIKPAVVNLQRKPSNNNQILVYISSAREFVQTPKQILSVFESQKNAHFDLFINANEIAQYQTNAKNIKLYPHGSPEFIELMASCDGIVSTAGHSLLSEAMYLGIPVYAIPVAPYEQFMNAEAVGANGFGLSHPSLEAGSLNTFVENLKQYSNNIKEDRTVLVRGVGQELIVDFLKKNYLSRKKILVFSPPFSGHLNILKELIKDSTTQFSYHLAITGWPNISPDLSDLPDQPVTILESDPLNETDPALWTFARAESLLPQALKVVDDFQPDLILYDFFSLEGYLAGQIKNIPYWSSIPALIGSFNNKQYCQQKIDSKINQQAIQSIEAKYKIKINTDQIEMVSDGFHFPGQVNLVWSYKEITPTDFLVGRADLPYVFVGNPRGDNYEKSNFRNHKPMIYLSFGTVVMNNLWNQQEETRQSLKSFIALLAKRWQNRDYQIIFVTQGKEVLPEYPQNWWVYDSVNQVEILSRADIFITHGGNNSFHESIMQSVPMLLVPFFGDQLLVAETAEKLKIGYKVGGSDSIDTHSQKSFLNQELVEKLDRAVSHALVDDSFQTQYQHLCLTATPITSLFVGQIPYQEGDLVVGSAIHIPTTKESLPSRLETYLSLLEQPEENLSPAVKAIIGSLKTYLGDANTLEQKKLRIIDFVSRLFRVHCPISKELEPDQLLIQSNLAILGQNISFYQPRNGIWLEQVDQSKSSAKAQKPSLGDSLVLTSENPVKLSALKEALRETSQNLELSTNNPKLNFDEQLIGLEQILYAASQRLLAVAKIVSPETSIISTVSGLIKVGHQFLDVAVYILKDKNGRFYIDKSDLLNLPLNLVQKAKTRGFSKFTVSSILAEEEAQKQLSTDPHILLSKGKISRLQTLAAGFQKIILGQ